MIPEHDLALLPDRLHEWALRLEVEGDRRQAAHDQMLKVTENFANLCGTRTMLKNNPALKRRQQ